MYLARCTSARQPAVSPGRHLCRACAQGRKAGRSAGDARGQIRVHHQPPDGQDARHRHSARVARHRRRSNRIMKRRVIGRAEMGRPACAEYVGGGLLQMWLRCNGAAAMTCERGPTSEKPNVRAPDKPHRRGGRASSAAVVRTVPSMTRVTIVVFGSRSEGFRLRGASRYPMSEGSVLRSCLDPPQRSVRTSAADLRSNRPGTDYRVDPL